MSQRTSTASKLTKWVSTSPRIHSISISLAGREMELTQAKVTTRLENDCAGRKSQTSRICPSIQTNDGDGICMHHEHKGPGRRKGLCISAERRFDRSGGASRLFEALLLELGVDLGQKSIAGPERREELVSTRGVGGADLGPKCGAHQCQARMLHSRARQLAHAANLPWSQP